MFMVKCKCGCFFTVTKQAVSRNPFRCQNCKEDIFFTDVSNILESSPQFDEAGIAIRSIPDTAKITVTFDA